MATMKNESPFIGTELKLNIHIEPIGDTTMDDYDFEVEVFCSPKKPIIIPKENTIRVDNNNCNCSISSWCCNCNVICR